MTLASFQEVKRSRSHVLPWLRWQLENQQNLHGLRGSKPVNWPVKQAIDSAACAQYQDKRRNALT
jgi:hypothetical protein